jgi:hypothetical protein
MVLEIEKDYKMLIKEFENNLTTPIYAAYRVKQRTDNGFESISEDTLLRYLRMIMNFQRKIEYSIQSTKKIYSKTNLSKRLETIGAELIARLCNNKKSYGTVVFYLDNTYQVFGIIPLLKMAHKDLLTPINSQNCFKNCYCAYLGLKMLNTSLIEFEEELRLISALTSYPIKKRILLKNQLVINDFEEVAISLEEAESNTESNHFKDTVSRCRDAVEILVAQIRKKCTGEKTEKHFAVDLGKIVKLGLLDEATKKLTQGVYSFLSLKGSHKYDKSKVTVYDAESSLQSTYSLVEMLLKKFSEFKKSKKK